MLFGEGGGLVEKTSSNFFYYAFIITAEHKYRNQGESWFGFVWEVAKSTYWDLKYVRCHLLNDTKQY